MAITIRGRCEKARMGGSGSTKYAKATKRDPFLSWFWGFILRAILAAPHFAAGSIGIFKA